LLITPTNNVDNPLSHIITKKEVQATKGGWLILAFHNDGPEQARVRVQYVATTNSSGHFDDDANDGTNSPGDLVKAIILIPLSVVGIVLCLIVYIKSRAERLRSRNRNRNRVHRQVNSQHSRQNYEWVVVMDHTPPPTPQNQISPDQTLQEKKLMSPEEIDYYFPKKAFSQLKTPFPQTTCSICLDDFKPENECHQLYCFHIFHKNCIGEWLAKHESCPDCRKPITREAIRKIIMAEKKRMIWQEYALLSRQSPNQSSAVQRPQSAQSL